MEAVANLFLALLLGIPLVGGATVAGKQEQLCTAMGGTFTPAPAPPAPPYSADVCPGGKWVNLVRRRPAPSQ